VFNLHCTEKEVERLETHRIQNLQCEGKPRKTYHCQSDQKGSQVYLNRMATEEKGGAGKRQKADDAGIRSSLSP
jgi:hypothetical protein